MSLLQSGRGLPVTVFAPGQGATYADTEAWGRSVLGTRVFFEYEGIVPWSDADGTRPRREADRDAAELRAVADEHQATRVVGVSRGARAALGVLAEDSGRFERVVLLLPPGGRAAGRYASWLSMLRAVGSGQVSATSADVLIIGHHGDPAHPVRTAWDLAERLSARLELFPSGGLLRTHAAALRSVVSEFLNRPA